MLFKTYSLSPYCFKADYLSSSFSSQFKIFEILKYIINNGLLFQISSEEWKQKVLNFLSHQDNFKRQIQELLIEIDKQNKILSCDNITINDENEWIENIKEYCENIDYLIATINQYCIKKLEDIEIENRTSTIQRQNEENLKKLLKPIIPFVSLVKLYDPYFNIHENRYKRIIELILELNSVCDSTDINIEIHTSTKIRNFREQLNRWQIELQTIQNNHIEIYLWKNDRNDRFHDRYISTNICALGLGKGIDIANDTDSTWTLLTCDEIEKIERKFNLNNPNGYDLLYKIDKKRIEGI